MSRVALVVGINTYRYDGLRDLKAPAEDAEAIAQRLEKYGDFKVIRLPEAINPTNNKPFIGSKMMLDRKDLRKALKDLFKPDSDDLPNTALFYFSGHGLWQTDWIQKKGYLATSDADQELENYGVPLQWLRELLQASEVKQQIVWLDCCHSGALFNVEEANPREAGKKNYDRCFIAASLAHQNSYQAIGSKYSVLTKALLNGLESYRNPQGGLTNHDLLAFLSNDEDLNREIQQLKCSNFGQTINLIWRGETVKRQQQNMVIPESINLIRRWEKVKRQQQNMVLSSSLYNYCPYKGLDYFEDNDALFFFGRTALTDLLLDRLCQSNFLVLLGVSGSGKSSLLRAGLLSQMRQQEVLISGITRREFRVMLPTEHPIKSLAETFGDPKLGNINHAAQLATAEKLLSEGKEGLRRLIETSQAPHVVLLIDQFEESFTLCQNLEEREQFFACLMSALEIAADKFTLVIAMRADFFGRCIEREYGGLSKRIEAHLVVVTPMNDDELRETISKPAEIVGCEVEPILIEEIVRDVAGSPANLPLMQFALSELWQLRDGNRLTLQAYKQELGGITGALEKRANAVYAQFTDELDRRVVKHIFLSLTQLGEGTEDTRRRVVMSNLVTATLSLEVIERMVQKLANKRLVVTGNLKKGKVSGDVIVDVAHESLIRGWSLLRGWLDEDRQNLVQQRWIEDRAIEWQWDGKANDLLLSGKKLKEAQRFQLQQIDRFPLSELAQQLLKVSNRQQKKGWAFVAIVYMMIPIVFGGFAIRWWYLETKWAVLRRCEKEQTQDGKCSGRIEALRALIDANVSLQAINLNSSNLDRANLAGINSDRANFSGANFSGADLNETILVRADLSRANFSMANLRGAYLWDTDLRGADLSKANLNKANFSGAYLRGANLNSANLKESNFMEADLGRVTLINVDKSASEIIKTACHWEKAIMSEELREQIKKSPNPKEKIRCRPWNELPLPE